MTLEEAWQEFQESQKEGSVHVSLLEARQLLREVAGEQSGGRLSEHQTQERQEQGRFLDWLLHVKGEKELAYDYLQEVGAVMVGPRQYWATDRDGRRSIAWESCYTYPGSDSEIWDMIRVDER